MNHHRILVILCGLAVGLATAIAFVKRAAPPPAIDTGAAPESEPGETANASNRASLPPQNHLPALRSGAEAPAAFTWHQVESPDYKQYIANLRSIGCPEATIRDIIVADVTKLYAAREAPLKPKAGAVKSVQTEFTVSPEELEKRRQLRELQMEKRAVIKELLGMDVPLDILPSSGSRAYGAFELALKALPAEKRDAVQTLQENYWQQSDALKAKHNNKKTPEFIEEYRQLNEAQKKELSKVLTTQELENYEIRTSTTASRLGQQLVSFAPTEDEFRQIFRVNREFEEKTANLSIADKQAAAQARSEASNQMNEQLRIALGEQRAAEYQRALNPNYRNLLRVAERYSLPQETVLQAYQLEESFGFQSAVPSDPANPQQAERNEKVQQLSQQLTAVLGEKAAKAYRRVRSGLVPVEGAP